jgi:ATP-binding cassette subfamily B protein
MSQNIPKDPIKFGIYISQFHKRFVIPALLFVFLATTLDRFSVVIYKNVTDAIITSPQSTQLIWQWVLIYPLLLLAASISWRASGFFGMHWFINLRETAYQTLYEYLALHSKDYFNNRFAGSLTNKISHAVYGTESIFEKTLWQFIPLFTGLFLYISFTWASDYRLGGIMAIWAIIFLSINIFLAKKLQPLSLQEATSLSTLKGRVVDSLSNISLVHEYAHVNGERNYIRKFISKNKTKGLRHWQFSEGILAINNFLIFLFITSMLTTAVLLYEQHLITVGVIIMIVTIVSNVSSQFLFISQEIRNTATFHGEAKEGLEEILETHTISDTPTAKKIQTLDGTIHMDALYFQYDNKNIFEDFSLTIPTGQKVGIVGKSGAGKTTLVSLILRHFDVQKGAITIGGHNILDITLESLRRNIAFVPQDTSMFHRTIKENISYSNANASDEEIYQAASFSQASEFINSLPKGYDTLVGERGLKLSGGQRQRIAIARAFLKNAPIVILDEATSSLDSQSEHAIQQSIEQLMEHRTVIAIAHRLSTLKKMDRIIVIDQGKILEDGTPEELLTNDHGLFKKLWDHQINGFIIDD